jgi:hypothetical protein
MEQRISSGLCVNFEKLYDLNKPNTVHVKYFITKFYVPKYQVEIFLPRLIRGSSS